MSKRNETCNRCNGLGVVDYYDFEECAACSGSGMVLKPEHVYMPDPVESTELFEVAEALTLAMHRPYE